MKQQFLILALIVVNILTLCLAIDLISNNSMMIGISFAVAFILFNVSMAETVPYKHECSITLEHRASHWSLEPSRFYRVVKVRGWFRKRLIVDTNIHVPGAEIIAVEFSVVGILYCEFRCSIFSGDFSN